MSNLKLCKNCKNNNEPNFHGYFGWLKDDCCECPMCKSILVDINMSKDDCKIIDSISDNISFLESMIELKEKDIIEYNLKISQFKAQLNQQESSNSSQTNILRCPTCSSTKIKRISTTSKVIGAFMFGLLSKTAKSQFFCEHCGYKW